MDSTKNSAPLIMRINATAIKKILAGHVRMPESGPCMSLIKIFSQKCKYCHNLKEPFGMLSRDNPDINFFVFDVSDDPNIELKLDFRGVPMLFGVTTLSKYGPTFVHRIDEPAKPNPHTWYVPDDINKLIDKVRKNNE